MGLFYDIFPTQLGWVGTLWGDNGVVRTTLPEPTPEGANVMLLSLTSGKKNLRHAAGNHRDSEQLKSAIVAYCDGEDVDLTVFPLDLTGVTPFFKRSWEACRKVARGKTKAYQWLAVKAGSPMAVRASGQAMARNRFPLLVPCHRIIGSDGHLHGFGGSEGLPMKLRLLQMEGATL